MFTVRKDCIWNQLYYWGAYDCAKVDSRLSERYTVMSINLSADMRSDGKTQVSPHMDMVYISASASAHTSAGTAALDDLTSYLHENISAAEAAHFIRNDDELIIIIATPGNSGCASSVFDIFSRWPGRSKYSAADLELHVGEQCGLLTDSVENMATALRAKRIREKLKSCSSPKSSVKLPSVENATQLLIGGNGKKLLTVAEDYISALRSENIADDLKRLYGLACVIEIACSEAISGVSPTDSTAQPDVVSVYGCRTSDEILSHIKNRITSAEKTIADFASDSKNSVVELIKGYIRKRYGKQIFMEDLANMVGLSPNYLGQIFKDFTGETITEYIHRLRIAKACDLIKDTNEKISQIAYDIGYRDANYFSRMFRQTMGVSPREYRENRFHSANSPDAE